VEKREEEEEVREGKRSEVKPRSVGGQKGTGRWLKQDQFAPSQRTKNWIRGAT
jgi:hypothetical protein